ncbi:MAG: MFS transporter, partial [Propionibacteriaceae bacterium]
MVTNPGTPQPVRPPQVGRPFFTFLVGVTLADLADRAWLVVLAFTAASLGSPFTATLVIAAGTLPRAVLVLVGGAFADRLPTRPLLVAADVLRAVVLLAAVAVLTVNALPVLPLMVVVGVLFGAADAVHLPSVGTMPRQLVATDGLIRAAGLRQMGGRIAYLAGPPLAGVALGALLLPGTLAVLVVPFVVAAVVMGLVRTRYPREAARSQSVYASVRELIGHLRGRDDSRRLVLSLVGLNFFAIPVVTVGVALRVTAEGWGPTHLGLLIGLVGAGAIVGTLVTFRLRSPRPLRLAYAMLALQGVALATIGVAPEWGVGLALGLVGLTSGLACPPLAGMLQARVEPAYLGRVYSLIALADDGILPLALAGFGAITAAIGIGWAVALSGLGMTAWMGASYCRPRLRNLPLPGAEMATGTATGTGIETAPDSVGTIAQGMRPTPDSVGTIAQGMRPTPDSVGTIAQGVRPTP